MPHGRWLSFSRQRVFEKLNILCPVRSRLRNTGPPCPLFGNFVPGGFAPQSILLGIYNPMRSLVFCKRKELLIEENYSL